MKLFYIFFLTSLIFFSSEVRSEKKTCICKPPECSSFYFLSRVSAKEYMAYLSPIDLDRPGKDLARAISYGDYRFLSLWDDNNIYFPKKFTEDKYLICVFGIKHLEGFEYHDHIIDLGDKEYQKHYFHFSNYVFKYNQLLLNKLLRGGLSKKIENKKTIDARIRNELANTLNLSERAELYGKNIEMKYENPYSTEK